MTAASSDADTPLEAFNREMEEADRPWRLAERHPRGWVLCEDPDRGSGADLLDLADAHGEREAANRARAWLITDGRLPGR